MRHIKETNLKFPKVPPAKKIVRVLAVHEPEVRTGTQLYRTFYFKATHRKSALQHRKNKYYAYAI